MADAKAMAGEWRVAGIDDQTLAQPFGISVSIGTERIHAVSQCVLMDWTFILKDGRIETVHASSAVPPCARPRTPDEAHLEAAMGQAIRVSRLENMSLLIDGPGGSVTLFTQ